METNCSASNAALPVSSRASKIWVVIKWNSPPARSVDSDRHACSEQCSHLPAGSSSITAVTWSKIKKVAIIMILCKLAINSSCAEKSPRWSFLIRAVRVGRVWNCFLTLVGRSTLSAESSYCNQPSTGWIDHFRCGILQDGLSDINTKEALKPAVITFDSLELWTIVGNIGNFNWIITARSIDGWAIWHELSKVYNICSFSQLRL